jgi:hypothetical protein
MVWSVIDIPPWNEPRARPVAGFGAIRCWQQGYMSFPMFGSHSVWRLSEQDKRVDSILEQMPRPFEQRKAQLVFRGGLNRSCSFAPDLDDVNWVKFRPKGGTGLCGRKLLRRVAERSAQWVNYTDDLLTMPQQEDLFKYIISVEGHGGWADRLSDLMLLDVGLMVQEHPCLEWYEYLFKPFVHYIPVSNNFDNIVSRIQWAERHPLTVHKMTEDRKALASRVLRQRGLITFTAVLLTMFGRLFKYSVEPVKGSRELTYEEYGIHI